MSVMSAVGLNGLVLRDARLQGIFSEFRLLGSRVSVQKGCTVHSQNCTEPSGPKP